MGRISVGIETHRVARAGVRALLVAALLAPLAAVGGCRMPVRARTMELVGEGHSPARLRGEFPHAYYFVGPTHTTVYLSEIPLDDLLAGGALTGQVMHLEMLWRPQPGETPIDSNSTNATIRHVVLVDGEVGVYAGAGFLWPHGRPGGRRTRMTVKDASMALVGSTDGFIDRLTPANLRGTFIARLDEPQTMRMRQAISQLVTDALQESRFVEQSPNRSPNQSPIQSPVRQHDDARQRSAVALLQ